MNKITARQLPRAAADLRREHPSSTHVLTAIEEEGGWTAALTEYDVVTVRYVDSSRVMVAAPAATVVEIYDEHGNVHSEDWCKVPEEVRQNPTSQATFEWLSAQLQLAKVQS